MLYYTVLNYRTVFNWEEEEAWCPPETLRFICHVFQRLDCPLKDIVINALYVKARRCRSPRVQSGARDTRSHPKATNQLHTLSRISTTALLVLHLAQELELLCMLILLCPKVVHWELYL